MSNYAHYAHSFHFAKQGSLLMNQPITAPRALSTWHHLMQSRNPKGIAALLADDVVFYSPVVHTPQKGKPITNQYLVAAFHVFYNETFRYVRETVGTSGAVLEFEVSIDGIHVNGVDMIQWNEDDHITEFKVMLRPLKAVNLIHQKMGEMLGKL
jgi:SnoaL-like domain